MLEHTNSKRLPIIGITHGDINGIGYEIILKTLSDSRILDFFIPIVYGQSKVFSYYKKKFKMEELSYTLIRDARQAQAGRINIINHTDEELKIEPGISTELAGRASFDALRIAVDDLYKKNIDALVTAPINKKNIQSEKFHFTSQKEYINSFCKDYEPLTLMVWNNLRVGSVTNHIAIKDIPGTITKELISNKLNVFHKTLQKDFGIAYPRIAVIGLNPHDGDGGLYGKEEIDIINPVVVEAREKDMLVFGPFSADGFFGSASWLKFDGVLCMYHDQALLGLKLAAREPIVHITAGLDFLRTSPTHGTAFDIAGKNQADPASMISAILFAAKDLN